MVIWQPDGALNDAENPGTVVVNEQLEGLPETGSAKLNAVPAIAVCAIGETTGTVPA